jgi:hypothetical protein
MASQLTFPDAPADDPIGARTDGPRTGSGIDEVLELERGVERERGMEIVDEIGTFAEAVPSAGATGSDILPVDLPVGSWFG